MPAAYDTNPNRFDEVIAEVCPHRREEISDRIDQVVADWKIQAMAKAKQAPGIVRESIAR